MEAQFPWDATKSQAKFFITEMNVLSDTIKINKMTFIWHEDMQIDIQIYRHLSADINCSKKHLQFFESIAQGNPFTSQNRHCPRTNIWAYFHTKGGFCVYLSFNYFFATLTVLEIGEYSWSHMTCLDQLWVGENIMLWNSRVVIPLFTC